MHVQAHVGGNLLTEERQQLPYSIYHFDSVGSWLALNRQNDRAFAIPPARRFIVFNTVKDIADLLQPNWIAVAVGNDERPKLLRVSELTVRHDSERILWRVERAGGHVDVARSHCTDNFINPDLP